MLECLERLKFWQRFSKKREKRLFSPKPRWTGPKPGQVFLKKEPPKEYTLISIGVIGQKESALIFEDEGREKVRVLFPSLFSAEHFLLEGQKIRYSVETEGMYVPYATCFSRSGLWPSKARHQLEILTGKLSGQVIKTEEEWMTDIPPFRITPELLKQTGAISATT